MGDAATIQSPRQRQHYITVMRNMIYGAIEKSLLEPEYKQCVPTRNRERLLALSPASTVAAQLIKAVMFES